MQVSRVVALIVVFAGFTAAAEAGPITLSAGQSATFNFDLTGQIPPPPYGGVLLHANLTDFDLGDEGSVLFFGAFNEVNFRIIYNGLGFSFYPVFGDPFLNDGLFSITLAMTNGTATFDPQVQGVGVFGETPLVGPVQPVPEPTSLLLLGTGGLGLLAKLRRRRATS